MSLLNQNRKVNERINLYHNDDNPLYELKKTNDSMSEKIKQNQKQKVPLVNQNGSNITSGLNTEKRNIYKKNYYNDEINSGFFNRNGSQSSLSVDLNRFKINPNSFNNKKHKETSQRLYSNNNNINLDENFETFNPRKDQIVSINSSKGNININNINLNNNDENLENIENSNIVNNIKKNNKDNKDEKKNANSFLKNFNPYDIKNFLGDNLSPKKKSKKINLVNNIPPSASNLQMIIYNKKIEDLQNQKDPEFLFKNSYQKESRRMIIEYLKILNLSKKNNSIQNILTNEKINQLVLLKPINEKENNSLNNTVNYNNPNLENSFLASNRKHPPFSINNSPRSNNLIESSSKNILNEPNSFRILDNFLNDMDDESKDKISLITFLSIPRIMKMIISKEQKYSYVFYCSPTNISCLYGIETYIFKWNECKNYNLVGYFDLINVENCYLDNNNKRIFNIILNNNKNNKNTNNDDINDRYNYCIETDEEEIANNYIHAISFASQLVKYRVYLNKKKKENKII